MTLSPHALLLALTAAARSERPFVTDVFTADPTAMVHDDTLYVYVGHDEAPPNSHIG